MGLLPKKRGENKIQRLAGLCPHLRFKMKLTNMLNRCSLVKYVSYIVFLWSFDYVITVLRLR